MSNIRDITEKVNSKSQEIELLNHVAGKLEQVRQEVLNKLANETNKHNTEDLNQVLNAVVEGGKNLELWPVNLVKDPFDSNDDSNPFHWNKEERNEKIDNSWKSIKFIGLNEIRAKLSLLNEQLARLTSQLPTEDQLDQAKFKASTLAIKRTNVQKAKLDTSLEMVPVLTAVVDLLVKELLPLHGKRSNLLKDERHLTTQINQVVGEYDLVETYKWKVPVKPVTTPTEVTDLINLCTVLIPQLLNGDTSQLSQYESLKVRDLQEV